VCAHAGSYYPKTHNPFSHICLRVVAIVNIIKGSGIQFYIPFMEIDPEINIKRLSCGATLLAMSHLLHFLEHIEHPEYQQNTPPKKNTLTVTVVLPDDLSQCHTQDVQPQ
jgi:hypothetical protein